MTTCLAWLLLGTPLLISVVMFVFGRYSPKRFQFRATLGTAALVLICLLISFSFAGTKYYLAPQWWPGSGTLYLKFDVIGLTAAFWNTAGGVAFYALGLKDHSRKSWLQGSLFLLVVSVANLAFLAGNFLFRYAALEMTALAIAVVLLETGSRNSKRLYLGLRLGDAGLLAAILLLNASGASFDISKLLKLAPHLSPTYLSWISAGFVLAVWVKVGLWPLLFWQKAAVDTISMTAKGWFLSTVMPNLGVYLLYKTIPIITFSASVQSAISMSAAISGIVTMLFVWRKTNLPDNIGWLLAFQGSIVVFAAAHGLDNLVWISILTASLIRLIAFGWNALMPQKKRYFDLVWGVVLIAYSFIVVWAVRYQGENKVDLWLAEVGLAMLVMWCFKKREALLDQILQKQTHQQKWQYLGLLAFPLLFFAVLPFQFHVLAANSEGDIGWLIPLTRDSLRSLPVLSLAFWGILIGVWFVEKIHWLENVDKHINEAWFPWLKRFRRIPESIYRFTEIALFQKSFQEESFPVQQFAGRLYKISEIDLFQQGIGQTALFVQLFARLLYQLFEKKTFDGGVELLVRKSFAFSKSLSRMHTGRLRMNLLWVGAIVCMVLAFILAGLAG